MADSSAGGEPSRSATTIVAARKHHVFEIYGYSRTLNTHGARPRFNSGPFRSGDRSWRISYRPMGSSHRPDNTDSVGFYIALDDVVDEAVMAQASFSLLDHDGRPVPEYTFTSRMNNFSTSRDMAFGFERFIRREDLERSEYLRDDRFAVRVQVYVIREAPSVAVPASDMNKHIGDLLASKEDADVKFDVGGETFEAHRLVLGARSPVFMAELFGPMKEGIATMAAADTSIQVDDMEPRVFEALLSFMYTDTWPETEEEDDECVMAQHLLVAADRYGMERLKLLCEDRLRKHIDTGSAATILALAEQHCCLGLKEACFEFLGSATALLAVVETEEDFDYLARNCPTAMEELISKVLGRDMEKVKVVSRGDNCNLKNRKA